MRKTPFEFLPVYFILSFLLLCIHNLQAQEIKLSKIVEMAFVEDDKVFLAINGEKYVLRWDLTSGKKTFIRNEHYREIDNAAFNPNGKFYVSAGRFDNISTLWETKTDIEYDKLYSGKGYIACIEYKPRSTGDPKREDFVAMGSTDSTITLFNEYSGTTVKKYKGHADMINDVAFSRDGTLMASCSGNFHSKTKDNTAKLWDINTGRILRTFSGHDGDVNCVEFTPDGKYIITASSDQSLIRWNLKTGKIKSYYGEHEIDVYGLAIGKKGKYMASYGGDLKLWNIRTGKELWSIMDEDKTRSMVFSPNGKYLLLGREDGSILFLDKKTGQQRAVLIGLPQSENYLIYTLDGEYDGAKDNKQLPVEVNEKYLKTKTENLLGKLLM